MKKCCNRKGGWVCLGPQKDHRPQTWWVREGLQYLKDPSRFLNKGSRLPIPGLYPLISHAMKHPQKAPASFHTDQHPPKHFFFSFFFLPGLSLFLISVCQITTESSRATETPPPPWSLPWFLYCPSPCIYGTLEPSVWFFSVPLSSGGRDNILFIFESPKWPSYHHTLHWGEGDDELRKMPRY